MLMNDSRKLHELMQSFIQVCDVISEVKRYESNYLLLIMVEIIFHIPVVLYKLIVSIGLTGKGINKNSLTVLIELSIWAIHLLMRLKTIVGPCYRTVNEVNQTKSILCQLMCRVPQDDVVLVKKLDLFMLSALRLLT
ncbi:unnamed protein product, partial [Iphiclides podalirius]